MIANASVQSSQSTRPCELNDVGTIELLQKKLAEANRLNDELRKALNDLRVTKPTRVLEYCADWATNDSGRITKPVIDSGMKGEPLIPTLGTVLHRGRKYKVEIVSTDYRVTEVE